MFPIIGRKPDAVDHVPGEIILGGSLDHNEVTVTLDNILVDSAFIAEIDELIGPPRLPRVLPGSIWWKGRIGSGR